MNCLCLVDYHFHLNIVSKKLCMFSLLILMISHLEHFDLLLIYIAKQMQFS